MEKERGARAMTTGGRRRRRRREEEVVDADWTDVSDDETVSIVRDTYQEILREATAATKVDVQASDEEERPAATPTCCPRCTATPRQGQRGRQLLTSLSEIRHGVYELDGALDMNASNAVDPQTVLQNVADVQRMLYRFRRELAEVKALMQALERRRPHPAARTVHVAEVGNLPELLVAVAHLEDDFQLLQDRFDQYAREVAGAEPRTVDPLQQLDATLLDMRSSFLKRLHRLLGEQTHYLLDK